MLTKLSRQLIEGEFLADYQVRSVIGEGPIATTYRVLSNVLHKEFALKVFDFSDSLDLAWLDCWDAQSARLTHLVHPHIDSVLSSGCVGTARYHLKDLIHDGEGGTCNLHQYQDRHNGRLSPFQVFSMAEQLSDALRAASECGDFTEPCAHGNLKPSNIQLAFSTGGGRKTAPFELRLSDFYPYALVTSEILLEICQQRGLCSLSTSSHRTGRKELKQLRTLYGAYDYQAPELLEGAKLSVAADIYSFGVLLYEALVGELPFGAFPKPSALRPDVSPKWDHLIETCLQHYPDLRYANYVELGEDLQTLRAELGIESSGDEIASTTLAAVETYTLTPQGMVYIPAGDFTVGSEYCGDDAYPPHSCTSAGFYIDRTPVTNSQFDEFTRATGYLTSAEQGEGAPVWIDGEWRVLQSTSWKNPTGDPLPEDFMRHPVVQVSYEDVLAYCEWKGRRLPSEVEWEYVAGGGQAGCRYPWGNTISHHLANYSGSGTSAVMNFKANGFGIHDVAGNVWEWTSSWYEAYPGNPHSSAHYGQHYRVVRGGAWMYDGPHCQIAYRNANQPDRCYPTVGFRTVCDFARR